MPKLLRTVIVVLGFALGNAIAAEKKEELPDKVQKAICEAVAKGEWMDVHKSTNEDGSVTLFDDFAFGL